MKIAIYETVHLDWIFPYCEWFAQRNDDVYFLANISFEKDIREALGPRFAKFNWHFMDPESSRYQFMLTLYRFFRSQPFDGIILNSVETRQLFLALALRRVETPILLNVHDVNNFFLSAPSLSMRRLVRYWGKKVLHQKAAGFIVNAASMKEYIDASNITSKKVYWVPPVVQKAHRAQLSQTDSVTFTVPGSIDEKRRDYKIILNVFEKLFYKYPGRFQLVLAGRPVGLYGANIIAQLQQLQGAGMQVFYSDAEIAEKAFQDLIANTTVLISPLRSQTAIHDQITEQYGRTKGSGNVYDAIRHGKPMIVPSHLLLPKEIISSCPVYQNADSLFDLTERCVCDHTWLNQLSTTAYQNAQQFTLEATGARLDQALEVFTSYKLRADQPTG